MKFIILGILFFASFFSFGQEQYIFTKEQHEQIRKNLNDYRKLIKDYDFKSAEFDKMVKEFELLKKLHSNQTLEFNELKSDYLNLKNNNVSIMNLTNENEKLKKHIESLNRELAYKNKALYNYKGKYERQLKLSKGDRIIQSSILGTFIVCGLWAIYVSYESNYGF